MAAGQSKDGPVFKSVNIKNIETLADLTANYVKSLIGATEESQSSEWSTAAGAGRPLSSDEEVKQLRAEMDSIDTRLNQYLQCTEILRRVSESIMEIRYGESHAKLPKLPGEILSMICEAYGYVERGLWDPPQKTTHRKLCDLLCGGEHVSIAVHVHNMSPQSFSKIMRRRGKAQLNVSTSWTFSTSGRKDSQAFRTFQDAVQFGDRWRTLSIKEDTKDAVDFVLHHCQSVLTQVRGLYIRGEFEDESKETKSWPILASTSSHIPSMRVAKVPLGCVAYSRCLFQHLTSLCVRLPEKLDQPENLVDCLRNLARLKRLTLLASARFDLGSYRTGKVASMPSLEELELMFDDLDMDVLTCMLSCISCQNVRKYIAHFDPLFEHYEDSGSSYDETQKSRDFALNLWSFLGERFPALEDITLGMQDRFSWDEEFMSILTEPLDAGRWLFSRLSSLTFHLGEGKTEQQLKCSTLLRLAVARAQEENISDIHSVTIYGLSD